MTRAFACSLLLAACSAPPPEPPPGDPACDCGARICGQLDCGAICGTCPDETACSSDGLTCIAPLAVGSACVIDRQCGVDRVCLRDEVEHLDDVLYQPGGYCTRACSDEEPCPDGAACLPSRGGQQVCMAPCGGDDAGACRGDEGYECVEGACAACVGTCEGRTCGSDGCGGACGVVDEQVPACDDAGTVCSAGHCAPSFQVFHQLPSGRWDATALLNAGGQVVLVGGRETIQYAGEEVIIGTRGVATVSFFDPVAKTFTPLENDLPEPIARPHAALVSGTLYVAGGTIDPDVPDAADVASTSFFKQVGTNWQTLSLSPLPEISTGGAAESLGGRLYLLPGATQSGPSSGFWSFDETRWTEEESRPTARSFFAAATDGERLWVVGGWDGESAVATVETWSAAAGWQSSPELPVAVASPRAVIADGRLFVFGGYSGPDTGDLRPWVQEIELSTGSTRLLGTTYSNFVRQAPVLTRAGRALLFGAYSTGFAGAIEGRNEILEFLIPSP